MADVVQTQANVKTNATSRGAFLVIQVGEAVLRGDVGYRKTSDGKYYKALASGTEEQATAKGIFQTPASTDGYAILQIGSGIDVGGTLVVAETYVLSPTAGKIAPIADITTTGHYVTILGTADAADNLPIDITATGVQEP